MHILVLFGQRKSNYPGQYAPEALEVIDGVGNDDNPDFMHDKLAEYEATREFEALRIITLQVPDAEVMRALCPAPAVINVTQVLG